jgi:hypothetical protein
VNVVVSAMQRPEVLLISICSCLCYEDARREQVSGDGHVSQHWSWCFEVGALGVGVSYMQCGPCEVSKWMACEWLI